MKKAPVPANKENKIKKESRLKALREDYVPDVLPETDFDNITQIASAICKCPISLISVIEADKQVLKSYYGLASSELPDGNDFCRYIIDAPCDILIVPDLSEDERFMDHRFVTGRPHVVFYAAVPLIAPDGNVLGSLCILDTASRKLDEEQIRTLQSLAKQVVALLELREKVKLLKQKQEELRMAYEDLEKIAHLASHDLKSPLNNIISLTHLLKSDYAKDMDEEGLEYVNYLNDAAYQLSDLISGILSYSRTSQLLVENRERILVAGIIDEVAGLLNIPENVAILYHKDELTIYTSRIALKQILLHLLHNAIKYNESEQVIIEVFFTEDDTNYYFEIKDNGQGIAEEDKVKIFELFEKLHGKIKDGESMGIGLAIAKRLVGKLGGSIRVNSEIGKGTSFIFSILKER